MDPLCYKPSGIAPFFDGINQDFSFSLKSIVEIVFPVSKLILIQSSIGDVIVPILFNVGTISWHCWSWSLIFPSQNGVINILQGFIATCSWGTIFFSYLKRLLYKRLITRVFSLEEKLSNVHIQFISILTRNSFRILQYFLDLLLLKDSFRLSNRYLKVSCVDFKFTHAFIE